MVVHVVLLKPRPGVSADERRRFVAAFDRATREIPSVRNVRVGARVRHGAGYEAAMPDTVEFLATIDFDDLAGLQAYLSHPAHDELGRLFGEVLSSALVYDFELGPLESLGA
jgi:hypothetical protein